MLSFLFFFSFFCIDEKGGGLFVSAYMPSPESVPNNSKRLWPGLPGGFCFMGVHFRGSTFGGIMELSCVIFGGSCHSWGHPPPPPKKKALRKRQPWLLSVVLVLLVWVALGIYYVGIVDREGSVRGVIRFRGKAFKFKIRETDERFCHFPTSEPSVPGSLDMVVIEGPSPKVLTTVISANTTPGGLPFSWSTYTTYNTCMLTTHTKLFIKFDINSIWYCLLVDLAVDWQ